MRLKTNWREAMAELEAEQAERQAAIAELREAPIMPEEAAAETFAALNPPPILRPDMVQALPAPVENPMMHSAPISRSLPNGMGDSRNRVTLSREEANIAAISGISVEDYARNKLRLQREIKAGFRQNG